MPRHDCHSLSNYCAFWIIIIPYQRRRHRTTRSTSLLTALDPCSYFRPSEHAVIIYGYLMMCHTRRFVSFRQTGVLYATPASCVRFSFASNCRCCTNDTSMVLTALGQIEHILAFDILWTMDLGVGMD